MARRRASRRALDEKSLTSAFHSLLPRKNNFATVNYSQAACGTAAFRCVQRRQLRKLVVKNIRAAVRIDREPLDAMNARIYRNDLGSEQYRFLERRQIFFAWEGLMRVILELEVGDRYREFSVKRDRGPASPSVEPNTSR
jgi:hypothetical protein